MLGYEPIISLEEGIKDAVEVSPCSGSYFVWRSLSWLIYSLLNCVYRLHQAYKADERKQYERDITVKSKSA